jgi:hypothetical protein
VFKGIAISLYDDPSGHAIQQSFDTTLGFKVVDCFLQTTNEDANAINSVRVDGYGKWSSNKYVGMTTPVSSVNPNQMINTTDSQGNILI